MARGRRLIFDRQADGRAKTGRAAIGTVCVRTERLVETYLCGLGLELHPKAILFRNRSGAIYREATLAHDFAGARWLKFQICLARFHAASRHPRCAGTTKPDGIMWRTR
jgi:hypothetical protein